MAPARKYSEYKYGAQGSRAVVWHGNAHHTAGGLTQSDLKENKKTGKIVSKKASASAKRSNNLVKAGWVTQKGVFGSTKSKSPKRRRRSKSPKRRRKSKSPKRRRKSKSPKRRRKSKSPKRRRKSKSPKRRRKSKSPKRRRRSKSPKRRRRSKSPKRHTRHVHVTRTSLKRKKKSPILHKHPK